MDCDAEKIRTTIDALDAYRSAGRDERSDAAEEFLGDFFAQKNSNEAAAEAVAELFFGVVKHERLFDAVLSDYYASRTHRYPRTPNDYSTNLVFLYYAVFEVNSDNVDYVQRLLTKVNAKKALALTSYLRKSDFASRLFERATQIWDVDHVRDMLDHLVRDPAYKKLHGGVKEATEAAKKAQRKPLTRPMELRVLQRKKFTMGDDVAARPATESASEAAAAAAVTSIPKPTPVPKTTYRTPIYQKRLNEDREKHAREAKDLYCEAQKSAFRVANVAKKESEAAAAAEPPEATPIRPKKIPAHKEPSIRPKKTAAVILREGARLMKIEQDEIKRLEDITRGAVTGDALKALEREIQEERTQKHMEEIEKKHLQGLLTYEESLLAKQRYLRRMKESADEFRREKELWTKQLEAWRVEEHARICESVEKGKSCDKGAKEAVEHAREEKHRIALETMEESKSLKEKWLAEKEDELKRKIQIIKEIKALQAFGLVRRKEALANAAANIGVLCGMSADELKDRLAILRKELGEELQRRRTEIKERKECRKAILDGYQELIDQHREIRRMERREQKKPETVVKSSSVEALKRKLAETRRERLLREVTSTAT